MKNLKYEETLLEISHMYKSKINIKKQKNPQIFISDSLARKHIV